MLKLLQWGYFVLQQLCELMLLIDFNHSPQLKREVHIAAKGIFLLYTWVSPAILSIPWRSTRFGLIVVTLVSMANLLMWFDGTLYATAKMESCVVFTFSFRDLRLILFWQRVLNIK